MTSDPIHLARELLDRAVRSCMDVGAGDDADGDSIVRRGVAYLLGLRRTVLLVEGNIYLRRCVADGMADLDRLTAGLQARDTKLRQDLAALRRESQDKFPVLAESASRSWTDFETLAYFDHLANGGEPASPNSGSLLDDNAPTRQMLDALETTLLEFLPQKGVDRSHPGLRALHRRWQELGGRRQEIHREGLNIERAHAGAVWRRLRSLVNLMNPSADSPGGELAPLADAFLPNSDQARVRKCLFNPTTITEQDQTWLRGYQDERNHDLSALNVDLQVRLGTRASMAWILARYARRCRRLRLSELQARTTGPAAKRKKELVLSRDAAVFLFDQGFEVLTEQSMGTHRYDIIGEPVLVEAKIYDGKRPGLAAVADGLAQIHQYTNVLADEGVHVEPVLLVFRLGGPRATPVPEYKIGNLRVPIAHVDLGSSTDSGRNSPPPEPDITEAIITAELARKTSAPGGKTRKRRRGG